MSNSEKKRHRIASDQCAQMAIETIKNYQRWRWPIQSESNDQLDPRRERRVYRAWLAGPDSPFILVNLAKIGDQWFAVSAELYWYIDDQEVNVFAEREDEVLKYYRYEYQRHFRFNYVWDIKTKYPLIANAVCVDEFATVQQIDYISGPAIGPKYRNEDGDFFDLDQDEMDEMQEIWERIKWDATFFNGI